MSLESAVVLSILTNERKVAWMLTWDHQCQIDVIESEISPGLVLIFYAAVELRGVPFNRSFHITYRNSDVVNSIFGCCSHSILAHVFISSLKHTEILARRQD